MVSWSAVRAAAVWSARRTGRASLLASASIGPLLAVALGAGVPALCAVHGWWARADQTAAARTADQLTTERAHLVHEALDLVGRHPLVGVGPGQYIPALAARYPHEPDAALNRLTPVHTVALLAAAEGGVAVGIVVSALLVVLGWRALRAGAVPAAVYLLFLPWWLLDHFPWTATQGVLMAAVWIGALEAAADRRGQPLTTIAGPAAAWADRSTETPSGTGAISPSPSP